MNIGAVAGPARLTTSTRILCRAAGDTNFMPVIGGCGLSRSGGGYLPAAQGGFEK